MNRPRITIEEAIRIAVSHAGLVHEAPYCASAIYDDHYIALVVFTLFQRYDFYVDAATGEILGIMSEPLDFPENEAAVLCD